MQVLLNALNFTFDPRLGCGNTKAIIGKTKPWERCRIQLIRFLKLAANYEKTII
jgi:hypothetical protein